MDADTFCREIEAYLCRKNDGHLVRVVGPAFGMVSGWAAQGVPFKVACRGIDRYFERYYAKGPRRRPIRIEFCEADVLDAFDEWRRAVGVGMSGDARRQSSAPTSEEKSEATPEEMRGNDGCGGGASSPPDPHRTSPTHSLRAHLDRAVTRLTDLQAKGGLPAELEGVVERLIEQLAGEREASRTLRGQAREEYVKALERLDSELLETARRVTRAETVQQLRDEAAEELADYRARMPLDAYERSVGAAADKLLRDHWKLPDIRYS